MKKSILTFIIAFTILLLSGCTDSTNQTTTTEEQNVTTTTLENVTTTTEQEVVILTLSLNGGELPTGYEYSISVIEGDTLENELPTPTKDGYTFIGWYTDEMDMDSEFDSNTVLTENITLYAVFEEINQYDIAMIKINNLYSSYSWEAIVEYSEENNLTYMSCEPVEYTDAGFLDAIELAIDNGVDVIVAPGWEFQFAIYEAQVLYPDVTFILTDGLPYSFDHSEVRINDNVYSILYAEEQAGFLAGYAAVKEGFTELGFIGGMSVPAVVNYGLGFIQGAEYAAEEMGLPNGNITIKYKYTGNFSMTASTQNLAQSWYNEGTEVIFTVAGGGNVSVMSAAESLDGDYFVIGADIDQSVSSYSVISSAIKKVGNSVYGALTEHYNGTAEVYQTGTTTRVDITNDGVGLIIDRFNTFTQTEYEAIYNKLKDDVNSIRSNIMNNDDVVIEDLNTSKVIIDYIE